MQSRLWVVHGWGIGWLLGLGSALAGCMAEDPRDAGVIVMDRQALGAEPTIEQYEQARSATALPLLVDTENPITIRTRHATQSFSVGYGELVRVEGPELTLSRSLLDHDVYRDRLQIEGPRATIEEVAAQISAEMTPRGLGSYELVVNNAFVHLAQLDPAEVVEVQPLAIDGHAEALALDSASALQGLDGFALDRDRSAAANEDATLSHALDPVGVYACGDGALSLDAANRFHSCALGAGHYRMQGQQLTLETTSGTLVLQLDRDGSLRDGGGSSCSLTTIGDEP